ncbi:MAG: hypothetical protein ACFB16_26330 [Phormidesmis sp.]
MNQYLSETPEAGSIKIRWAWFALGCSCLVIGSVYLSLVDLNSAPISAKPSSDQLAVSKTAQTTAE